MRDKCYSCLCRQVYQLQTFLYASFFASNQNSGSRERERDKKSDATRASALSFVQSNTECKCSVALKVDSVDRKVCRFRLGLGFIAIKEFEAVARCLRDFEVIVAPCFESKIAE